MGATDASSTGWQDTNNLGQFDIIKGTTQGGYGHKNGKYYSLVDNKAIELTNPNQISSAAQMHSDWLAGQTANKQQQLATEFRGDIGKYSGLLQDQANKTIQRNLAEKIRTLKHESSRHGFLGGSGTQRQQAEELVSAGQETQAKKFDIQDMLEKQAQQFENQALATKLSQQGSANQAYIDQLRQNILDTQRQTQLWQALGQAVGPAVGYYMAGQNKSTGTGA